MASNPIRVVYPASATGAQEALAIDWRDSPEALAFEVQFNAGASGSVTVESTLDNINDTTITPDWMAETAAITGDTRGVIASPVQAIRLNVSSLAGGTITFKVLQGSPMGAQSGASGGGGGGVASNVNVAQAGGIPVLAATPVPVGFYNPSNGLLLDPSLPAQVVGSVAAGAADSGNPIKVGGYASDAAPSAAANGQRQNLWLTPAGATVVAATTATGADGTLNTLLRGLSGGGSALGGPLTVAPMGFNGTSWDRLRLAGSSLGLLTENGPYQLGRVTADGQIKGSAGFIHTVSIAPLTATPTAGLLTIYNSLTETGTVVYSEWIFATTPGHTITLDIPCSTGIFVGFDGALANVQVTVAYR